MPPPPGRHRQGGKKVTDHHRQEEKSIKDRQRQTPKSHYGQSQAHSIIPSHTVTDGFKIISEDMYNLSLIKIPMKYLLVEVLYPKIKNNAEVYRGLHKKTNL